MCHATQTLNCTVFLFQILDSRDLKISKARYEATGEELDFTVGEPGYVGAKVEVKLPTTTETRSVSGKKSRPAAKIRSHTRIPVCEYNLLYSTYRLNIVIEYETSPSCSALQWLPPAQTAGKTHPYLFSQCQAIHCRSMVPLQDTPAVKSSYSAEVRFTWG